MIFFQIARHNFTRFLKKLDKLCRLLQLLQFHAFFHIARHSFTRFFEKELDKFCRWCMTQFHEVFENEMDKFVACYNYCNFTIFFKFQAFNSVRQARAVARLWGIRAKKAKEAEADDLSKPAKK